MSETNKMDKLILNGQQIDLSPDYANVRNKPNIANDLETDDATKILSAKQGKILKFLIDESNENINSLSNTIRSLPIGYFYGTYETDEELEQLTATEQGYAYVGTAPDYIVYVYTPETGWNVTDNKYGVPQLETNLNTKSTVKAPTTKAVADGIDSVNLLEGKNLTTLQKYNASANINNRPADEVIETGVVKALGYKVLNPELTFASQVQDTNTIYEIRDEFDLSNSSVIMPSGCTLRFNGGRVTNGTITGSVKVEANDFSVVGAECFPDGFNMSEDVLYSERIGMIANDASYATRNNHIIDLICAMPSKKLILTNLYYITGKRNVIGAVVIEGGCLQFANNAPTKSYFDMKEHSSLTLNEVRVIGTGDNGKRLISTENTLDYQIDEIIIKNCDFFACVVVNIDNVANKKFTTSSPFGIKRFVVKNNKFDDIRWNTILLNNCVISDEMTVEGNFVNGFIGQFISIGQTNSYSYNTNNKKYQAEFIVRNNTFIGRPYATTDSGEYFCPCLFEGNRVIMDGNIIKNVIAVGTNYAYDSYVSSNEYYFTNNTVINVTNFRLVKSNSPRSEIFKSKGRGFVREAIGNKWYIDYNEIEDIVISYGFTIPDGFSVVKEQMIFNFTSKNDYLNFSDNTIELKGGVLSMSPSSCALVEAVINRNTFKLDSTTGSLMPYWGGDTIDDVFYQYLEKLEFCGNVITVKDKEHFYVACGYAPIAMSNIVDVRIENNVSNVLLGLPSRCKRVIFRNNILTDTNDIVYPSWTNDKYYSFDENSNEYTLTTTEPADWKTNYMDYYTKSGDEYFPVIGVTKFVFRNTVKVYKPIDSENSYIETPFVGVNSYAVFNDYKYQLNNVVFETPQLPISENSYFFVFNVALNQKVVIELPEIGLKQTMIFIKDGEDDVYVKNEVGDIVNSYKLSNISGNSASPVYIYTPEGGTSNNYQKIYYNLYKANGGYARFVVSNPSGKLLPRIKVTYYNPTIIPLKNDSISKGIESFNGKPNYWNGIKWVGADGIADSDRIGATANRPTNPPIGFCYYDTDFNRPTFWRGDIWTDAFGQPLELSVSDNSVLLGATANSTKTVSVYYAGTTAPTISVLNADDTDNTWLTATLSTNTLTLTAAANTATAPRGAKVLVTLGDELVIINVVQSY